MKKILQLNKELITSHKLEQAKRKTTWNKKLLTFLSLVPHVRRQAPQAISISYNLNLKQLPNQNVGSLGPKTLPLDSLYPKPL
jgi:hypothetical protein